VRRVLLTGATGFVGSHLARALRSSSNYSLTIVPRAVDLVDRQAVRAAFAAIEPVDYIIHAADLGGDARWASTHAATQLLINAGMSLNLLDAWRDFHRQARLVGLSSLWAYPASAIEVREERYWDGRMLEVTEHYGLSKKLLGTGIQAMQKEHGMRGTMLVLGNVYGPGDRSSRVVPSLIHRMLARPKTLEVWGDGTETRDFVYIDDQVEGILRHLDYDGDLLNVTTGKQASIREVVSILTRITNFKGEVSYSKANNIPTTSRHVCVDKATAISGWPGNYSCRTLEDGLERTVEALSQASGECSTV
jgi:nucleoside-diphosphate-sugar epimerase